MKILLLGSHEEHASHQRSVFYHLFSFQRLWFITYCKVAISYRRSALFQKKSSIFQTCSVHTDFADYLNNMSIFYDAIDRSKIWEMGDNTRKTRKCLFFKTDRNCSSKDSGSFKQSVRGVFAPSKTFPGNSK